MAAKQATEPDNEYLAWASTLIQRVRPARVSAIIRDLKLRATKMDGDRDDRSEARRKLVALLRASQPAERD